MNYRKGNISEFQSYEVIYAAVELQVVYFVEAQGSFRTLV